MSIVKYNGKVVKYGSKWVNNSSTGPETAVIGGKTYPVVEMPDGNKWLAVNLDYIWDGLSVPTSDASVVTNPMGVYFNYDEATYGWDGRKCGLLYNWYAVSYLDQNKATLCPGWHIPTDTEWNSLIAAVGGNNVAGKKLKASDVSWAGSWSGTDDYGFTALPAGVTGGAYGDSVSFADLGTHTFFWTPVQGDYDADHALRCNMSFGSPRMMNAGYGVKTNCCSVRLIKDA